MKTVSIHDAKTNLSKYIAAAKKGEKIYIGGFGKAEVLLIKLPDNSTRTGKRNFSIARGRVTSKADAFSDATDSDISELMLGR